MIVEVDKNEYKKYATISIPQLFRIDFPVFSKNKTHRYGNIKKTYFSCH